MNLLISFPDQSESFTYGVEYGRLLEKMESGQEVIENKGFPVRIENIELLRNTCKAYGYLPVFSDCAVEGWVNFMGIKKNTSDN